MVGLDCWSGGTWVLLAEATTHVVNSVWPKLDELETAPEMG